MLKIDGVHIQDIQDGTMSHEEKKTIINYIARNLSIPHRETPLIVVAEWVKNNEHLRKVQKELFE